MGKQFIRIGITIFFLFASAEAWACEHCRPLVESGVYNPDFFAHFVLLMAPLAVLATLGLLAHYMDAILANLSSRKGNRHGE